MKKVSCPICAKPMDHQGPAEWPHWPFCGARCRTIDLGRWLGGNYRIAAPDQEEDPDDAPNPADPSAVPHREEA